LALLIRSFNASASFVSEAFNWRVRALIAFTKTISLEY
jgi:hypothetical protein